MITFLLISIIVLQFDTSYAIMKKHKTITWKIDEIEKNIISQCKRKIFIKK